VADQASGEEPKPLLVQLFEAAAAAMDLNEGQHTLELHFEHGHLHRWTALNKNNGHEALRCFDANVTTRADLLRNPCRRKEGFDEITGIDDRLGGNRRAPPTNPHPETAEKTPSGVAFRTDP
jgi:hypothetical protein